MTASAAYSYRFMDDGRSQRECSAFSRPGSRAGKGELTAQAFPGRWNPRRAIPPEYASLCGVVGRALDAADWWKPGSGELVDGGLVVVRDGGPEAATDRFALAVHDRETTVLRPNGFLQALPSTLSSVLGLLYGLRDYHATLVGGPAAGVRGLRHLLDLIALGRIDRGVLALLSDDGSLDDAEESNSAQSSSLAIAVCFDGNSNDGGLRLDCGWEAAKTPETHSLEPQCGAAFSLLGLAKHLETCFCGTDPDDRDSTVATRWSDSWGWIELDRQASLSK